MRLTMKLKFLMLALIGITSIVAIWISSQLIQPQGEARSLLTLGSETTVKNGDITDQESLHWFSDTIDQNQGMSESDKATQNEGKSDTPSELFNNILNPRVTVNAQSDETDDFSTTIIFAVMGEATYFQDWCARLEKATILPNDLVQRKGTRHRAVTLLFGSFDVPITNTAVSRYKNQEDLQQLGFMGCRSIYIPKTTWTEGRNLLAKEIRIEEERLGKMYDFWVFVDDDVELHIHGTKKNDGWQGFGSFIDYLVDDIPPNATTVSASSCGRCGLRSVTTVDAMLAAFPRKFVPYLLPYATLAPLLESQWNSQACLFCIMTRCFKSSAVYPRNIVATNEKHRDYIRGLNTDVIFQTLQRNFADYKFDLEPCRNFSYKQNLDVVGPFHTSSELSLRIPPPDFATCDPLLDRFTRWESSILDQRDSNKINETEGLAIVNSNGSYMHSVQKKAKATRKGLWQDPSAERNTTRIYWQSSSPTKASGSCVPISLILFGVPKEFPRVWNHYLEHIVKPNPSIPFEAHMHMYSDLTLFTNAKNNEVNVTTESPSDIQRTLNSSMEKLAHWNTSLPMKLITSDQEQYDENLWWLEPTDVSQFTGLSFGTLKNIFRQGNSIQQAYVSASAQPLLIEKIKYDRVYLFLRSDTLLVAPLILPCSGLPKNEIHLPSWQTRGHPEYNDRAALAGSMAAYKYARAKTAPFRHYIIAARKEDGKDVLRIPRNRRTGLQILHNPEKMLKMYLDSDDDGMLNIVERNDTDFQLIRVRSGGEFHDAKRWCINQKGLGDFGSDTIIRGFC